MQYFRGTMATPKHAPAATETNDAASININGSETKMETFWGRGTGPLL